MRCIKAQRWVSARLDGELSARRARTLTRHLGECAACRREAMRLREAEAGLDRLGDEHVAAGFVARFRRRLEVEAGVPLAGSRAAHLRRAPGLPHLAFVELLAAAAMLLLGLGMAWGLHRDRADLQAPPASPLSEVALSGAVFSGTDFSGADVEARAEQIFRETFGAVLPPESTGARYLALLRPEGR